MLPRILGLLVAAIGLTLAVFAVIGLGNAEEMSDLIRLTTPEAEAEAETLRWLRHWRRSSLSMLLSGSALVVAGIGLFRRRKLAVLTIAGVALFLVLQDFVLLAGGWARYAFEFPEAGEIAVLLVIVASCWFVYRRWHPSEQ